LESEDFDINALEVYGVTFRDSCFLRLSPEAEGPGGEGLQGAGAALEGRRYRIHLQQV